MQGSSIALSSKTLAGSNGIAGLCRPRMICGGEWHSWNAKSLRKSKGLPLPFKISCVDSDSSTTYVCNLVFIGLTCFYCPSLRSNHGGSPGLQSQDLFFGVLAFKLATFPFV